MCFNIVRCFFEVQMYEYHQWSITVIKSENSGD